ncbi:anaphase promoting complex subunit 2 [Aspergillus clavatus NRRL 1]|uniref:Anaphase-promoting complex subunit 2 n=1 Tax=Aspergillus clavatus (strain ATCC 1007 / CBS 513.65 / DSM 816 / NCTC 3887 / NRRL 1 / QM 1276 / 107) TaxID=344612 RepID=A1CEF0_ASPCL|nr:anaphase-promoting complex subunit ApcB, putative [Aspergillus clavatus NRRL 1]EAW11249.1 anaphase-promoting complex subunit ApcB, putative [Aspergillus clavatus NRRL 1]
MASTILLANRKRMLDSVFPPAYFTSASNEKAPPTGDKATWDQAWRVATTFLKLPEETVALEDLDDDGQMLRRWIYKDPSREIKDALAYLLAEGPHGIIDWYRLEIRMHFLRHFHKGLAKVLDAQDTEQLQAIVRLLGFARQIYFAPFVEYILPWLRPADQEKELRALAYTFQMVVGYALPWSRVSELLFRELTKDAVIILGIDALKEEANFDDTLSVDNMEVDRQYSVSYQDWREEPAAEVRMQMMAEYEDVRVNATRERLLSLLRSLQLVGLGGDKAQKVFASVMDMMLTVFIESAYANQWEGPSLVTRHLQQWVENVFARLVVQVLAIINHDDIEQMPANHLDVSLGDVERWQEMGISRLGSLRTRELFDIIVEWPASSGAIEDLRHFSTHPASRYCLTQAFVKVLNQRLLHPGASTVEILQVYISIIRAFNLLDPKGVLLDRVARPIRRYLRDRDDTVKVIVEGLLSDPTDTEERTLPSAGETLVELAAELTKAHQNSLRTESGELDWDDMNWMPDPVDAAPDYRKSKTSDVIGSLISLFDSKETFVREMQNMLAERLLQKRAEFEQEMSVLELLKVRFGDSALQACEVMLRDIFDSRRVDTVVRNDQGLARNQAQGEGANVTELHAKILSHFFWPEFPAQEFHVPPEIGALQERYATGFGSLKQSRKLTWLNGMGQVTVELDLEDRVFVDEVTTWQATVIYAFNSEGGDSTTKTVDELSEALGMSTALVRSACLFWVSKRILSEVQRNTFTVLEALPTEDDKGALGAADVSGLGESDPTTATANAAAAADAAAAAAAKETAEAAAMEKMNLYWQFIVGMLTNQGAMPLQRIVMMLKIAVPGGFPFSNEELREFLAGMVAKGQLEIISGGSYKIVQ